MAQTGYTPIQLYYSTTAAAVPTAGNLASGELAINITDGKLYYKNNSGTVTLLAGSGGGGPAAGSNTQIQFNSSGVFGASSSLTWDGTYLTAGSIKDSALTSGRVTFAGASGLLTDDADLTFDGTTLSTAGLTASGAITASGGTANGVTYLNGSKVLTSGSALTFDGASLSNTRASGAFSSGSFITNIGSTTGVFSGDSTLGLVSVGSYSNHPLAFYVNNAEAMRLTSTSLYTASGINVAFGTSTIGARLTTQASANTYPAGALQINSLSGTYKSYITNVGGLLLLSNSSTVDQLILDSAGNLGLGVTPSSTIWSGDETRLVVKGNSASKAGVLALQSQGTTNATTAFFVAEDLRAGASLGTSTNSFLAFQTNGSERARIDSSGNLGIGTSSPSYKLEVVAPAGDNIVSTFRSGDATAANNAGGGFRSISSATATSRIAQIWLDADGADLSGGDYFYIQKNGNSGNVDLVQYSNAAMTFTTNAIERMRLDSAGNLGLGTSSPNAKLHVAANGRYGLFQPTTSTNAGYIGFSNDSFLSNRSLIGTDNSSGTGLWNTGGAAYALSIGTIDSLPIVFATNNTERMRLDSAGNLGLGVTPSAWSTAWKALQFSGGVALAQGGGDTYLGNNWYYNGTSGIYIANGAASISAQSGGKHIWYTAASGTAGDAISFSQAMTLDASGNLGIGTTSPSGARCVITTPGVDGANEVALSLNHGDGGLSLNQEVRLNFGQGSGASLGLAQIAASYTGGSFDGDLRFRTNSGGTISERARIDSSGNLLVGGTSQVGGNEKFSVQQTGDTRAAVLRNDAGANWDTLLVWNAATTGDNLFQQFSTEATVNIRGAISYNRAGGLTVYGTTSDYRAKDISGPVTGSGALIDSVPVYMGKMKGATQERPMFIAHETPTYAHMGVKDAVDADGNPVYQQMDASALIPVMWAEIQSLRARVAQLETN